MMKTLILTCAAFFSAALFADTVHLTNGNTLEGRVRYADGKVYIDQPDGTIMLPASKVSHVEKGKTIIDEWEERLGELDKKKDATADEYAALGKFAADRGLKRYQAIAYRKSLGLDANHDGARKALGYVKHDGVWMTADEANLARGLVKHDGAWITPEAKEDLLLLKEKVAIEKAKVEAERLKMERLEKQVEVLEQREALRERYENEADEYHRRYGDTIVVYRRPPTPPPLPPMGAGSPRPVNPSATVPPPPLISPISNSGLGTINTGK